MDRILAASFVAAVTLLATATDALDQERGAGQLREAQLREIQKMLPTGVGVPLGDCRGLYGAIHAFLLDALDPVCREKNKNYSHRVQITHMLWAMVVDLIQRRTTDQEEGDALFRTVFNLIGRNPRP